MVRRLRFSGILSGESQEPTTGAGRRVGEAVRVRLLVINAVCETRKRGSESRQRFRYTVMRAHQLKPNVIVQGPLFPEPVQVIVATPLGAAVKLVGKGLRTSQVYEPILSPEQLATLEATPEEEPFDGDATRFRLGIEAMRLALAYEYDPYFTLSIARVDPLPHQLEAVYDYFLKLPRIRFLLADDPGAGKTIMAGLLIKELKIRGLIQRILIAAPANLSFQ